METSMTRHQKKTIERLQAESHDEPKSVRIDPGYGGKNLYVTIVFGAPNDDDTALVLCRHTHLYTVGPRGAVKREEQF